MRCDAIRARIQDWLDGPGAPVPPGEIAEHLRDCAACRSFVTEWNRIELGLQLLRDETPLLSTDFGSRLHARIHQTESRVETQVRSRLTPHVSRLTSHASRLTPHASSLSALAPRLWQLALAGGVALVLLVLALQLIETGRFVDPGASFARSVYGPARLAPREGAGGAPMPREHNAENTGHSLATTLPLANSH